MVTRTKNDKFSNILSQRYLAYALSTITSRALPDIRDGLKPVHRRIIFAMYKMRLYPEESFKKSAKIIGEVMGNYHPHGGQAIYDALVRLAQDFSVRLPLANGQGNFGSIDGDNAAAMRYTESKMTLAAMLLLEGLDENAVDFRQTYDGEDQEPVILPAAFPNLLVNGASGIAVGMATNIPSHNPIETIDAAIYLLKHKQNNTQHDPLKKICKLIKGPDLPTGGICIDTKESIFQTYKTGKGSFTIRAKWYVEKQARGKISIIVTEIPYQINKSKLIEKIAIMIGQKKITSIANIIDESAEDIRIVLETKSCDISTEIIMEDLFSKTDLEAKTPLNMNVIDKNATPRLMNLFEVISEFNEHRHIVLVRRKKYQLNKIEEKLHLLDGLLIAYLNIDEVIKIIRFADHPKSELMKQFNLSELQATSILNLRLRAIHKLEEIEIKRQHKELLQQKKQIKQILKSPQIQVETLLHEYKETRDKLLSLGDVVKRRTQIIENIEVKFDQDIFVEKEDVTIYISKQKWIRTIKLHDKEYLSGKYKESDEEDFVVFGSNIAKLIVFTSKGKSYLINCNELPMGRGFGEPITKYIQLSADEQIIAAFIYEGERHILIANDIGLGFVCEEEDFLSSTKKGKLILSLKARSKAKFLRFLDGQNIAIIGTNKKVLIYDIEELPLMKKGMGVLLQKVKDGSVNDIVSFDPEEGLKWLDNSQRLKEIINWQEYLGKRAQAGKIIAKGFAKNLCFMPKVGKRKY